MKLKAPLSLPSHSLSTFYLLFCSIISKIKQWIVPPGAHVEQEVGGLKWRQHDRMLSSQTSCLVGKQGCGTETRSSRLWLSAGLSSTCESFLSSQVLQESNNLDLNGGLGLSTLMLVLFFRSADQAKKQTLFSLFKTFSFCVIWGKLSADQDPPGSLRQSVHSCKYHTLFSLFNKKKLQQSRSVHEGLTSSQV